MPITVQLTPHEVAWLDSLAERTGCPRSYHVRQALAEYLDDMEDLHLAKQVELRVRAGTERVYTLAEVEAELGLADLAGWRGSQGVVKSDKPVMPSYVRG